MLVDDIKASHQRLKDVFGDIVSGIENEPENLQNTADPEFIEVSWSRMGVQTQGIVFDASRLSEMLREEADQARQQSNLLILALIGAFIAFLFADYLLIFRRILMSVSNLKDGTKVIGSGNLDYSLEEKKDDEIGELAHAFNLMTANLKTVTASKADLEREIVERKRAEERLTYQANLLTNITDVIYSTDEQLRLTSWNHAAEKVYGWKEEEVLGRNVAEVTGSKFDPEMRVRLAGVLAETGSVTTEIEHTTRSGKNVIFDSKTMLIRDTEGKVVGFIAVNRDITERKRAERELERLASFPRLNPNPVVEVDLEGRVHFLNPAAQQLFPDLRGMGRDHPWLADWELVARIFHENKTSTYVRMYQAASLSLTARCQGIHRSRRMTHRAQAGRGCSRGEELLRGQVRLAGSDSPEWMAADRRNACAGPRATLRRRCGTNWDLAANLRERGCDRRMGPRRCQARNVTDRLDAGWTSRRPTVIYWQGRIASSWISPSASRPRSSASAWHRSWPTAPLNFRRCWTPRPSPSGSPTIQSARSSQETPMPIKSCRLRKVATYRGAPHPERRLSPTRSSAMASNCSQRRCRPRSPLPLASQSLVMNWS